MTPRALGLGIGAVPAVVALALVLGRWVIHGPVDGHSLRVSVRHEVGDVFAGIGDCTPAGPPRVWLCDVSDDGGSGSVTYRVTVEPGGSCWRASRQAFSVDRLPKSPQGCVHLWQWSLLG